MDARRTFPAPTGIDVQVKALSHDLQRVKLDFVAGRLQPDHYALLSEVLEGRLRELEAVVHAQILERARMGAGSAPFAGKPAWGRRSTT